jgi:3-phenylpropionate/trans-cinnamate dioxygenase ferredoxin reductase component
VIGDGTATGVRLADNSFVQADAIIVGVGITPNVGLAAAAGLDTDNGIKVGAQLRSSNPDIYAAGVSPTRSTRCSAGTSGSGTGPTR